MYVKIELFKTNFDEENVFVGTPSKTVDTVLDGFAASEKLVLPLSPFNLKYPFRLALPYFNVARKYNYARYRFYSTQDETATPADTRYYFVEDFIPIDDQSTEIRAREDILARVFYDLTYQSFLPDRMTYKNYYIKHTPRVPRCIFDTSEFGSKSYRHLEVYRETYNLLICQDSDKNPTTVYCGGIIITAVTDDPINNYTIEGGVSYPVLTLLLPFAFEKPPALNFNAFNLIKDREFRARKDISSADEKIESIDAFLKLSQLTEKGFKIVSTDINFTLGGRFDLYKNTEQPVYYIRGTLQNVETVNTTTITLGGSNYLRIIENKTDQLTELGVYTENAENFETVTDILDDYAYKTKDDMRFLQSPFYKFIIRANGQEKEINPLYLQDVTFDGGINKIYYIQSFLPPYSKGIAFEPNDLDNIAYFDGSTSFSYFTFDDTYAEFLRANYNAQITGLKVRQQSEREALGVRSLASAGSNIVSGISGTVAGAIKGGAVGATAAGVSAVGSAVNNAINTAANWGELSINQEKEQRLLDLRLADVRNLPDVVNISNALALIWSERLFFTFGIFENLAIVTFYDTIQRYGVSAPFRAETMINHSVFDYVRCTDITFTQKTITLSEVERAAVEKYFRDGVRLWYDYSHYKDFNADNPEV